MMLAETSMGIKSARSEQNWATCVNSISSALMVSATKLGGEDSRACLAVRFTAKNGDHAEAGKI